MKRPLRAPRATPAIATLALAFILSGCAVLTDLLPSGGAVEWVDSAVRLGVYLDLSPLPVPYQNEDEAGRVAGFTGNVTTGGSYTLNDDLLCEFDLEADAAYALDLALGTYLEGFSGAYDAVGDGFNEPGCTYETYALFEWVIEFEVVEPVTMQLVATLYAEVVPGVAGNSLHYVLVRQKDATTPIWIGESEEEDVDEAFDESIPLEPGTYEFAVFAQPLLQGDTGLALLSSGWTYDVTFATD